MYTDHAVNYYGAFTPELGISTLILRCKGQEQVINLQPWKVSINPNMIDVPSSTGMFMSQRPLGYDITVNGSVINETYDAQIRYLTTKKFSQKRIDIVNIDPALQWQPREKIS